MDSSEGQASLVFSDVPFGDSIIASHQVYSKRMEAVTGEIGRIVISKSYKSAWISSGPVLRLGHGTLIVHLCSRSV